MRATVAIVLAALLGLVVGIPRQAEAEEFLLPDTQELATLPPEGLTFYAEGIKALDHVNYEGAYESLSKAATLQPNAIRLNMIVAALALKFGRSKRADEAKEYYETAITCYQNILRVRGLEPALRRNVQNRLKIASEERDNLAQRDAQREGKGGLFIQQYNRELVAAKATPKATPAAPAVPGVPGQLPGTAGLGAAPGTMAPLGAALPQAPAYPGMAVPGQVGGGQPVGQFGSAAAMALEAPPAAPGAMPQQMPGMPAAEPGAMPGLPGGEPGGMPGLPPLQGAPPQPGGTPLGQQPLI